MSTIPEIINISSYVGELRQADGDYAKIRDIYARFIVAEKNDIVRRRELVKEVEAIKLELRKRSDMHSKSAERFINTLQTAYLGTF